MQSFVPPVVLRDAEPRNRRRGVHHLRDFLFERHARDEIIDALVQRERRVQVRRLGLLLGGSRADDEHGLVQLR